MPNAYFQANSLWRSEKRDEALRLLNSYLESELQQPVMLLASGSASAHPDLIFFDLAIQLLLTSKDKQSGNYVLQAPFARVWPLIWELDPSQTWISFLLKYNFNPSPDPDWEEEEEDLPPQSTSKDFTLLADMLVNSAVKGILSPNPLDYPNGGRAVLPMAEVEEVAESRWGDLKKKLLEDLPGAYERCPPDFWVKLVAAEPEEVLLRFLHDVFLKHNSSMDNALGRWQAISTHFKDYARAVLESLDYILKGGFDINWLTEVVKVDAGITSIKDGEGWLRNLRKQLVI